MLSDLRETGGLLYFSFQAKNSPDGVPEKMIWICSDLDHISW